MIPFASQRGSGQDLATHLLNEFDNEYMELADLRGSVADDLHGAFAEWELEASAMTKCKNYLYSLSVNPDHRQRPMTRELYEDYIARVEESLGLVGQPRAVVMHIKNGREHAHIVWSRVDVQEMKAIHMPFDHDKLMGVTRRFAREHDIELAPGYHRIEERKRQTYRQLSLYEKAQSDVTGITREDRSRVVTELWQGRDTPAAFVQALEYHGYILAHGKRPFVLVDIDGNTNSLPKLVDDKAVTTKVIAGFLGEAGAEENLPSVDEAKALAAQHREALKEHRVAEDHSDRRDQLKARQVARRERLELEASELESRQEAMQSQQTREQADETEQHMTQHAARVALIEEQRKAARPTGLGAFLAKVSGVQLVRGQVHAWRDRKRDAAHAEERNRIEARQADERLELQQRHNMQSLDMARKQRALEQTEQRERQSLEKSFKLEANTRQHYAHRRGQQPSFELHLKPPGRPTAAQKAMRRHTNPLAREMSLAKERTSQGNPKSKNQDSLQSNFRKAAGGDPDRQQKTTDTGRGDEGGKKLPDPDANRRPQREFRRSSRGPERRPGRGRDR